LEGASIMMDSADVRSALRFTVMKLIFDCSLTLSKMVWNCGSAANVASSDGTWTISDTLVRVNGAIGTAA